tara:strand:- start:160 stop:429 length:270 start_codon:yes stop_codon:yes gene_type:complete
VDGSAAVAAVVVVVVNLLAQRTKQEVVQPDFQLQKWILLLIVEQELVVRIHLPNLRRVSRDLVVAVVLVVLLLDQLFLRVVMEDLDLLL